MVINSNLEQISVNSQFCNVRRSTILPLIKNIIHEKFFQIIIGILENIGLLKLNIRIISLEHFPGPKIHD